jgi:hypothetical protein
MPYDVKSYDILGEYTIITDLGARNSESRDHQGTPKEVPYMPHRQW